MTASQDLLQLRQFVLGFLQIRRISDKFTGQRAVDENHFAVGMGDAAAFLVQGFDSDWLH